MGDYSLPPTMYEGADYTLDPGTTSKYSKHFANSNSPYLTGTYTPAGTFSAPSDPRTANQLDAVSKKISTGLRNIEVSGVNIGGQGEGALGLMDNIPKQHFKEINRLKELAGVELTFHGPLVEPTGIGRGGWDPEQRKQAEREMISAMDRAHDLDPKGNIIVTFHASNGLPDPGIIVKKDGKEVQTGIYVIDEQSGQQGLLRNEVNYFADKKEFQPKLEIETINKRRWAQKMNVIAREAENAQLVLRRLGSDFSKETGKEGILNNALKAFNLPINHSKEYEKIISSFGEDAQDVKSVITTLTYSRSNAQDAYLGLQDAFNQAMTVAVRDKNEPMKKELTVFREEIAPYTIKYEKSPKDLLLFLDKIGDGVRRLQSLTQSQVPIALRPLKDFALDKASETFANVAFDAYKKFGHNKKENTTPIVSIENPPVGMGLSRGDELRDLVEQSHTKFIERATSSTKDGGLGMSKKAAEEQAKKLIGVTWDVGHINMLRKYGFDDKDLVKQTETVGPYVKHIHLSDNFGMEHTELPMGMGNVPIKEELAAIEKGLGKEYFKKVKQVIETGGWFRNFNNVTPFAETLEAFGSPIYGMKMAPYWNRSRGTGMGYFSGYGRMLPDVHFSTYGAGFSTLPPELGGQMAGRSRMSGTPTE